MLSSSLSEEPCVAVDEYGLSVVAAATAASDDVTPAWFASVMLRAEAVAGGPTAGVVMIETESKTVLVNKRSGITFAAIAKKEPSEPTTDDEQ